MNLYMNINGHVRGGGINKLVKLQSKRLPARRSAQKHTAERDVVCQVRDSALQLPIVKARLSVGHWPLFLVLLPKLPVSITQQQVAMVIDSNKHSSKAPRQGGQLGHIVRCFHMKLVFVLWTLHLLTELPVNSSVVKHFVSLCSTWRGVKLLVDWRRYFGKSVAHNWLRWLLVVLRNNVNDHILACGYRAS